MILNTTGISANTDAMKETFEKFIRQNGLRLTRQRQMILDALLGAKGHISGEELYDQVKRIDPGIGQATVYRLLKLLHDAGMASAVDFGDGFLRYEPVVNRPHHDHLVCIRCKKSIEFRDARIEGLQYKIAKEHGFKLTGHRHNLFGICRECREE